MDPRELTALKETFLESFCESPQIAALLNTGGEAKGALKYKRIFPYLYDASAAEETGAFLCIDVSLHETELNNYKRLEVMVWSYARQQELETAQGNRSDLLAQEAFALISGQTVRARVLRLDSMIPFRPAKGYRGKRMIFGATVMD